MQNDLEIAIRNFASWDKPWRFREHILAKLQFENDRSTFEAAWNEAVNASHWSSPDLANGAIRAERAVHAAFPGLSEAVATAIVRAASYLWK